MKARDCAGWSNLCDPLTPARGRPVAALAPPSLSPESEQAQSPAGRGSKWTGTPATRGVPAHEARFPPGSRCLRHSGPRSTSGVKGPLGDTVCGMRLRIPGEPRWQLLLLVPAGHAGLAGLGEEAAAESWVPPPPRPSPPNWALPREQSSEWPWS